MVDKKHHGLERVLDKVNPARRRFLERLLLAGGTFAAIAGPVSTVLAQGPEGGRGKGRGRGEPGKGKGDGDGRGRGKGDPGKGKGDPGKGKGDGRGKGKGKGKGTGVPPADTP